MGAAIPVERLLDFIQSRCIEEGVCWLWQGAMSGSGTKRPEMSHNSKKWYVRRLVWELVKGPIPSQKNLVVIADCGNHRCVSPECIKLITYKKSKHFHAERGAYSDPRKIRKAALTRRSRSRITEEVVEQIKAAKSPKEAAKLTGVSESWAKAIRNGTGRKDYTANPFAGMFTSLVAANDSARRAA